jgi:hypothetical protein
MQALCSHYKGDVELDIQTSKAQHVLNTLVFTNEKHMTFKAMIMKLNKAYNALKRQGQEFTEKSKLEQLAKRIKNPSKDIQITVAVENMHEIHKANYMAAMQYITTWIAQNNSASINAPGSNARRISEVSLSDLARTEWNRVDIRNQWRKFTEDKCFTRSSLELSTKATQAGAMVDMNEAAVAAKATVEATKAVVEPGITMEPWRQDP